MMRPGKRCPGWLSQRENEISFIRMEPRGNNETSGSNVCGGLRSEAGVGGKDGDPLAAPEWEEDLKLPRCLS